MMTRREWSRYQVVSGTLELLEASFVTHVYERHFHDTYAIGVTRRGVQRFRCGGACHDSVPGDVIVIRPGESHDGQAGTQHGYAYRMFYVAEPMLRDVAADTSGSDRLSLRRGVVVRDAALARALSSAWRAVSTQPTSLEAEERLFSALGVLAARHEMPASASAAPATPVLARVRDHLHDHLREKATLTELAALAGMSRFQLTRRFHRAYGLPLHAYHLQLRLHAARQRLARGESISGVALDLGFADQSHMHRRFKAAFGVTPGQWRTASDRTPNRVDRCSEVG